MTGVVMEMLSASPFIPVTISHVTAGSGNITIPAGARNMVLEAYGAAGNGGTNGGANPGGGGGSGGYCLNNNVSVIGAGGQTIAYVVGAIGSNTTLSSGTFSMSTITAGSGGNGGTVGSGTAGTASGGTTTNTPGVAGDPGGLGQDGNGANGTHGILSTGASGGQGQPSPGPGSPGGPGQVWAKFT